MKRKGRVLAGVVSVSTLFFASQGFAQPIGIVALGDSNTAGFGVGAQYAFPAQLEAMLRATGHDVRDLERWGDRRHLRKDAGSA